MHHVIDPDRYDLVTPDGVITFLERKDELTAYAVVFIEKISPFFVGFSIDQKRVLFNIKSTLAQLGVDGIASEIVLDKKMLCAEIKVTLHAIGPLAVEMLNLLTKGASIGKLFAADERRRVRDPEYLARMFGRSDRWGKPLLSLGGLHGSNDLILDKVDGRCVAYLTLQHGQVLYDQSIRGFLPTLAKALTTDFPMRQLLLLHQEWHHEMPRNVEEGKILLVKTLPLHIRTVFGMVVEDLLSPGFHHTTASVLQPDTQASGDIYELYGKSKRELTDIPLEFYTLEPYREYVFFSDRDQLQACIEDTKVLFEAFETAPKPDDIRASVFVVKGEQMLNLKPEDWISRETRFHEFPGSFHPARQALMVERYIEQQPAYPFLKNIDDGIITSQGVLMTRFFPSPLMKRMLLGDQVQRCLKGIYFQYASQSNANYFSYEDRAFLHDLDTFGIPVFWVDKSSNSLLQYVQKPGRDSGMFVPPDKVETFVKATLFGIYGSNLLSGDLEGELREILGGVLQMRAAVNHPLLHKDTPIAMVTGGGPGVMELGNKVAKELSILSCANVIDFRARPEAVVNEQKQNPYVEAKMTYRLDKLVERQAEFNLDFPIFLMGGIGTDFEFSLEEVRRKTGAVASTPILLLGRREYWQEKITSCFQCNKKSGTIKGSEWISNCFYAVENAKEALEVYRKYFSGELKVGPEGPIFEEGFCADIMALK